jgi:hypothetical protein
MLRFLGFLGTAALTACAQPPGPAASVPPGQALPPPALAASGQCDAAAAQFAVGQIANGDLAAQARERAGATRVRLLKPNEMVTMEFDAMRLNLDIDNAGRVTRVRCG